MVGFELETVTSEVYGIAHKSRKIHFVKWRWRESKIEIGILLDNSDNWSSRVIWEGRDYKFELKIERRFKQRLTENNRSDKGGLHTKVKNWKKIGTDPIIGVTKEDYIQRGRVLLMGGKGSEDLVEILRITSANIIQVSSLWLSECTKTLVNTI